MPSINKSIGIMMLVGASTSVLAAPQFQANSKITLAENKKDDNPCMFKTASGFIDLTGYCSRSLDVHNLFPELSKKQMEECYKREDAADKAKVELECPGFSTCSLAELESLLHTCWGGDFLNNALSLGQQRKKKIGSKEETDVEIDADADADPSEEGKKHLGLPGRKGGNVKGKKGGAEVDAEVDAEDDVPTQKKGSPTPKKGFPLQTGEKSGKGKDEIDVVLVEKTDPSKTKTDTSLTDKIKDTISLGDKNLPKTSDGKKLGDKDGKTEEKVDVEVTEPKDVDSEDEDCKCVPKTKKAVNKAGKQADKKTTESLEVEQQV